MKIIEYTNSEAEYIVDEVTLMRESQHPAIVGFVGAYYYNDKLWVTPQSPLLFFFIDVSSHVSCLMSYVSFDLISVVPLPCSFLWNCALTVPFPRLFKVKNNQPMFWAIHLTSPSPPRCSPEEGNGGEPHQLRLPRGACGARLPPRETDSSPGYQGRKHSY